MTVKTKTQKTVEELNIIDDTLFQKMAEDIGFCEELISTVLQQKVIVEKVIPQNSVKNLQGRSVILDAYCVLEDGSSIAKLMKIYQKQDEYDFENFPNTSNRKKCVML